MPLRSWEQKFGSEPIELKELSHSENRRIGMELAPEWFRKEIGNGHLLAYYANSYREFELMYMSSSNTVEVETNDMIIAVFNTKQQVTDFISCMSLERQVD